MNDIMPNGETHHIPGWDRPKWAVRGTKDRDELTWTREASIDVNYCDTGVEETFAPQLIGTDQVALNQNGAVVHVGETVIRFTRDATITPKDARKLAAAPVELADYADGLR
jgi:hypothetical protein